MICKHCGREIQDGSKFCSFCGAPARSSGNGPGQLTILLAIAGIAAALAVIMSAVMISGKKAAIDQAVAMAKARIGEEDTGESSELRYDKESTVPEQSADQAETDAQEETQEPLPLQEELTDSLLVAVPVDTMSLRSTPGLGTDVISELRAGTMFIWDGTVYSEEGRDFYQVKVRETGEEGYVAADFCTPVQFECSYDGMDIVDTGDSLYSYDAMCEDIKSLCGAYPQALSSRVIGRSVDGRDIWDLTLGNPDAPNQIMVQAGIHGREYVSAQLVMKMAEYYGYYYKTGVFKGVPYEELFKNTAIHIVPMSNPDGITISQFGESGLNDASFAAILQECYERDKNTLIYKQDTNKDMSWVDTYKDPQFDREAQGYLQEISYAQYLTQWKANARGVDLNRNFDAGWGQMSLKTEPASDNFKGYEPNSEPEVQALIALAQEREYRCFISYHARGQLIYCDSQGNTPQTAEASRQLAEFFQKYNRYKPVNTVSVENVELGGFSDWVQLVKNMPSITIEMGKHPCPVQAEEFPSIWERNRETWAALCYEYR